MSQASYQVTLNLLATSGERKPVDWTRRLSGLVVYQPKVMLLTVPAGALATLFDGTRSTSIDNTTQLSLVLSPLSPTRYRLSWTGTGTAPAFRVNRALALSGKAQTLVLNSNGTLTVTSTAGDFTSVVVGDIVLVPGVSTGDAASPFNPSNEGYWTVVGKASDSSYVYLGVLPGEAFRGSSEVVTPSTNNQLVAFSAAGVQPGDELELSAGFTATTLHTYRVDSVTSTWVEFVSSFQMPVLDVGIPTTSGIKIYSSAKRAVYTEADQECVLRFNGDTSMVGKCSPWVPADQEQVGVDMRSGPTWSMVVLNTSTVDLNLTVISVE